MILVGDSDRLHHLFLGFPLKSAIAHQIYLVNPGECLADIWRMSDWHQMQLKRINPPSTPANIPWKLHIACNIFQS
ncbi:MAG: hypothetical protein AB1589_39345 [Cyanobacteriota bacterium]